jgi:16S rRNA (guanine527-N7)-methyltransferase
VVSRRVRTRLAELSARFGLPDGAEDRLTALLELIAVEPAAITSVRDPAEGVDMHVADSLVALELPEVRRARAFADLGSGGGFPGLVLALALPRARVALVESVGRKCAFLERAGASLSLDNVEVVQARAEAWAAGLTAHEVVTARALAPLGVLVEYAAPLLAEGGMLVAWKGRRDETEEAQGATAAALVNMSAPDARTVEPFPGARDRHLYLSSKVGPTPAGFPRRAGMARKRPLGRSSGR